MNLLADESVDQPIVTRLRQEGHSVVYVAEVSPSISDDAVLQQANSQGALLLTADKDFGELVFRHNRVHAGVVLIRLFGMLAEIKAEIVAETLRDRAADLPGAFTVVSPGMVRIRRYP
jgi:predicted nuclease of predicted toxin-antitoxin system